MGIYDGPPRVVAYVRVSQEREGMISPELQLAAIEQVCDRFGYLLVATISDLDLSGQFWKRRQVEVAVQMIEDGAADVVMVWKWSRFARNRRDWALAVDRIESAGGQLESATEPVDASTSAGRLARGLLAEFAAFESERAGDMWREAQQRRTRAGLPGTGREHFGYRYRAGQYLPHPVTGPLLAQAYRRYIAGQPGADIGRWLHAHVAVNKHQARAWPSSSVLECLDSGFGAGFLIHYGKLLPAVHTAVITKAEWQAYRAARTTRSVVAAEKMRELWPLTGFVWCGCGYPMRTHRNTVGGGGYCCSDRPTHPGTTRSTKRKIAEAAVLDWLGRLSTDLPYALQALTAADAWADQRGQDARDLTKQISRLDPDTQSTQREQALTELRTAQEEATWGNPHERAQILLEDWNLLDTAMQRHGLRTLLDHILITTRPLVITPVPTWADPAQLRRYGTLQTTPKPPPRGKAHRPTPLS
jgi:site-specific DNA recombinase